MVKSREKWRETKMAMQVHQSESEDQQPTWRETTSALDRLESLLKCSVCLRTLNDPHTLSGCYHHFCRSCILDALSHHSVCPNCNLPAWLKDLRTNRQLNNIVQHIATLKDLTKHQHNHLTPSIDDKLNTESENVDNTHSFLTLNKEKSSNNLPVDALTISCADNRGEEKLTLSSTENKDNGVPTFKVPRVGEQLIRRRLKKTYMKSKCFISRQNLTLNSKPMLMSSLHRISQGDQYVPPEVCVPSDNHPGSSNEASPMEVDPSSSTVNKESTTLRLQSNPLVSVSHTAEDKINDRNNDTSTSQRFGQPKSKRRSTSRQEIVKPSTISKLSLEFPFTPLVTKTRQFAKLDHVGKLKRLQGSGASGVVGKKSEMEMEGGSSAMQPMKRMYQLSVKTFMKPPSLRRQEAAHVPKSPSASDTLVHLPSGTPPPPTPSTAQVRTMRRNIRGETPLHLAAIKGDLSAVRSLLQQGADPNVKDHAGWTPLHEACNHGHLEVTTALLDAGALLNIPGFENDTPLHDAVANRHTEIATLLLSRGANPDLRNRHGVTAQQLAMTEAMNSVFHRHQSYQSPKLHISPNAIRVPHASPILNGGPSQVVLLGTGLKGYQKDQLHEVASLLGAKVVDSFSTDVSHVVTVCDKSRCCPRTLKFLCAVAIGKWTVDFQWISKCLQERCWVDETPFEVQGVAVSESTMKTQAPKRGRENVMQKLPGLFDGCEIFLAGNFSPPRASKEDLSYLIKLSGGKVLTREPRSSEVRDPESNTSTTIWPCHSTESITTNVFIVYDPYTEPIPTKSSAYCKDVAIVPASWLLDCITHFQLLKTDSY